MAQTGKSDCKHHKDQADKITVNQQSDIFTSFWHKQRLNFNRAICGFNGRSGDSGEVA